MKNAYKITDRIVKIEAALLHGDGPTFKKALNISPNSFCEKESRNHVSFGLFDFRVEQPKTVARLWNELPHDEPMRCFTPGYRIEFCTKVGLILKSAICWECNWIEVLPNGKEKSEWYSFNGESEVALELLSNLRVSCKRCIEI